MDGHTISEVAELTGFSPSALRFYEGAGLIQPARTPAGYRTYDQAGIDTLRFIARAKRLGLRLDDIRDLVALLDDQRCRPVQQRLRALLHDQIDEGQQQIASLIAFVAQLRQAAARLDGSTPEGACDDTCGCTTDSPAGAPGASGVSGPTAVTLGAAPAPPGEPPIACTLGPAELPDRIGAWQAALRAATGRERIGGGVRVHLPRATPIASLASLIEAEQRCCAFFTFGLEVRSDQIIFEVSGPPGAEPVIHALVGAPA